MRPVQYSARAWHEHEKHARAQFLSPRHSFPTEGPCWATKRLLYSWEAAVQACVPVGWKPTAGYRNVRVTVAKNEQNITLQTLDSFLFRPPPHMGM